MHWKCFMWTTLNLVTLKKAPFVLRTNDQIEMLRESESRSMFIRVIQRVSSFQKGRVNIMFVSTSDSAAATCCHTAACTSNCVNQLQSALNLIVTFTL